MGKSIFDLTPEGRSYNLEKARLQQKQEIESYKVAQQERQHNERIQVAREQQESKERQATELQNRKESHDVEMQRRKENYDRIVREEKASKDLEIERLKGENERESLTHKANLDLQNSIHNQHLSLLDTRRDMHKTVSNALSSGYSAIISQLGMQMTDRQSHKQEMEKMKEQFKIDKAKLILEQELKEKTMNHEQIIYLTTKIIEKAMGLEEAKIDRDRIRKWIGEISDKQEKDK